TRRRALPRDPIDAPMTAWRPGTSQARAGRPPRTRSSIRRRSHAPIVDHVGNEQREREEDQAEEEVEEEAVSLPGGNAGRPEGDRDPENDKQDVQEHVLLLRVRGSRVGGTACRVWAWG